MLSDSSPRVLRSQPWFLSKLEPDFHLLSQTSSGLERKIAFAFSCSLATNQRSSQSLHSFAQPA